MSKSFILSKPFATVKTTYTYTNTEYDEAGNETSKEDVKVPISLWASEADSEGNVFLMEENGKLIYDSNIKIHNEFTTEYLKKLLPNNIIYHILKSSSPKFKNSQILFFDAVHYFI